ncbi:MAG: Lipid-A-disaccharide synthase [Bacteroidota bacterium]|jgi:lipid-A-disaccharide synthase
MRYYLIAGEASGDLHGSNLMNALRQEDASAEFRVWGGDLMQQAGGNLVKHYRDLAFMGFFEVVRHLPTILGNLRFCKKDIVAYQPNVLILIDYPGFNLRIAKWAKARGIKVIYYIAPQVWAWKEGRVKTMKKVIDKLLVILPFEPTFFKKHHWDVTFVGHPLLDVTEKYKKTNTFRKDNNLSDRPIIALLPGSRTQEIERMLGEMVKVALAFPIYQFVIAGAPSQSTYTYERILKRYPHIYTQINIKIVDNQTYNLLANSHAALVTSGTATLETALFGVPQIVCYKGNSLSYFLAKRLVKVKYISLVNLILDAPVVPELIQSDLNIEQLRETLRPLLNENHPHRIEMKAAYATLKNQLGGEGASLRAAKEILNE